MAYYRQRAKTRMGASFPPTVQPQVMPASIGGINTLDSFLTMPPQDCVYCYNIIPGDRGMQLRKGYVEWSRGVGSEIRTLMPFEGSAFSGANNRLFACTQDGIYNVSTFGDTTPTRVFEFPIKNSLSGLGNFTQITNDAGNFYLFYADESNGLLRYDESAGLWSAPADITGSIVVANVRFVKVHKQRLWLVEEGSGDAWYLPVDSIAGAATKFTFGSKFVHGGQLMGLWNWTVDGGAGVDDFFVAISKSGDVLAYKGSDPSLADWGLVGAYYVGEVPRSRRIALEYGANLFILSRYGLTALSDLLGGVQSSDVLKSATGKVSVLFREAVEPQLNSPYWSIEVSPGDNALFVVPPAQEASTSIQFVRNLTTGAWGMWRGVPIVSIAVWQGDVFFGWESGSVYLSQGSRDGDMLDGTPGSAIEFSLLTAYTNFGAPTNQKMVSQVRTLMYNGGTEKVSTRVLYDYDVASLPYDPGAASGGVGALWGVAHWDSAVWDQTSSTKQIIGAQGMGQSVAVALRGSASSRIILVEFDITYTVGGFM